MSAIFPYIVGNSFMQYQESGSTILHNIGVWGRVINKIKYSYLQSEIERKIFDIVSNLYLIVF